MMSTTPIQSLCTWAEKLEWDSVSAQVHDRLLLVLYDTVACIRAGAATDEFRDVVARWPTDSGPCSVAGYRSASATTAAWLNGTAAVALEMDAGNRQAGGHPAAHVIPAVLSAAQQAGVEDGSRLCTALLAGHETAYRFGRSVRLAAGLHPHGSWAGMGAALGCSRLSGSSAEAMGAALDFAGGMQVAAPFRAAPEGAPVRDHWVGHANAMGVIAAAMGVAGPPQLGLFASAMELALGSFDDKGLVDGIGESFGVTADYIKRHSCCGYVHAPVDALIDALASAPSLDPEDIDSIEVLVTSAATVLTEHRTGTRMSAMFSIPHVLAAYTLLRSSGPAINGVDARNDQRIGALAARIAVRADGQLDDALPRDRGAAVTIRTAGGAAITGRVANAVGDGHGDQFSWPEARAKAAELIGPSAAGDLEEVTRGLPTSKAAHRDVQTMLQGV